MCPRSDYATITKLNFSNSGMGVIECEYLAHTLTSLPNLKYLDVSGNNITAAGEGYFVKALKGVRNIFGGGQIKILMHKFEKEAVVEEAKKQGDLIFGSKEERQEAIKYYLNRAKGNGVDVDNIVASKDI